MKKKVFAVLMAGVMGLGVLAGCGSSAPASTAEKTAEAESTAEEEAASEETTEEVGGLADLKIAFLLDNSSSDGGWSQSNYEAILRVKADMGLTDEQVTIMESIDAYSADAESVVEMLCQDGCDLIIGCTSGFTSAISTVAARHPEVYFAQYEGATMDNVRAYSVRDMEALFLNGVALAMLSESNDLGAVACQPQATIVRDINSMAMGAKYINPDATLKVIWANSWYDPAKEKEAANTLYNEGKTAICAAVGTNSVYAAAQEDGIYTNGYYLDQSAQAPNAIVNSFVYNWDPIFEEIIKSVADGAWSTDTIFYGMRENACYATDPNPDILSAEQIAQYNEIKEKLMSGEIEVFVGPLNDNHGNQVLAEGESFEMDDYINMLYLAENVIGSLPTAG